MNLKTLGQMQLGHFKNGAKVFWGSAVTAFCTLPSMVRAEIPTTDDFADGADDLGGFETVMFLIEKVSQLAVIAIAAYFVVILAKGMIHKYNEITDGRGSWMDLGGHVLGGLALLVLTIVALNWIGTWVDA
jgi:NADH:ubiquinone oxidoreductase subunit 4 (subunit M)